MALEGFVTTLMIWDASHGALVFPFDTVIFARNSSGSFMCTWWCSWISDRKRGVARLCILWSLLT